jgi:hypothetical protein
MTRIVIVGTGARRKLRPRGKPFKKGERHAFQFKPGQSGNPGGKPKIHQRMGVAYAAILAEAVPDEVALAAGIPLGSTWAMAIARGIVARAARGDVRAAREVREVTEGKVTKKQKIEGNNGQPLQPPLLHIHFTKPPGAEAAPVEGVREVTEGRVPAPLNVESKIDDTAD